MGVERTMWRSTCTCTTFVMALTALFFPPNLVAAYAASGGDACTFTNNTIVPANQVLKCFMSVPLDQSVHENTLHSLTQIMQLYAFLDLASDPPDNPDLAYRAVDLLSAFAKFEAQPNIFNGSDFLFQTTLSALFRGLQDAHTRYIVSKCYQPFNFWQPLSLVSYVDGGASTTTQQQRIHVDRTPVPANRLSFYQQQLGVNLSEFAGATVISINGVDALQHLIQFAEEHVGLSKDLSTRFNLAVTGYEPTPNSPAEAVPLVSGAWQNRGGDWSPFPSEANDKVTYTVVFQNGTQNTYTFPWFVEVHQTYLDTHDFIKACMCSVDCNSTVAIGRQGRHGKMQGVPVPVPVQRDVFRDPSTPFSQRRPRIPLLMPSPVKGPDSGDAQQQVFLPLVNSKHIHVYRIAGDNRTVVMYVDTFGPEGVNATLDFEDAVSQGLAMAASLGLDRLILDLSENGGGDICLGRKFVKYVMGDVLSFGPTDMPQSELANAMASNTTVQNNVWSWDSYTFENLTNCSASSAWLTDGVLHTRGGRTRAYSHLLHLSPLACSYDRTYPSAAKNISQIIMLTRGLCGSTCAFVANHAKLFDHVKVVSVGGLLSMPTHQYTSFPGLQVLDTPSLWDIIDTFIPASDSPVKPARLLTSAHYRMCIREIYPHKSSALPTEYTYQAPDWRLFFDNHTVQRPEYLWLEAASLFNEPTLFA